MHQIFNKQNNFEIMSNVGKYKKKLAVLAARQKAWESNKNKAGHKKPGSQKGNW